MTKTTSPKRHCVLAASLVFLTACWGSGETGDAPNGSTTGSTAATPRPAPTTYTLAAGTVLDAELVESINSGDARAGDAFTARVVGDVTSAATQIAIPAGSIVQGTIVEVSPAPNERSTGTLTLAVSSVTVRGASYPLEASIDSLETMHEERGLETADAVRIAGGAAAGAVLGRVIGGDTQGAIIGGVAGGATGAVVSVVMRDMDIVLPAGAHLILTLRQPLVVAAR